MKHNIARALCFSLFLVTMAGAGSLVADENTVNLESVIIQNFDDPAAQPWFVIGSKFSTAGFPKTTYYKTWPESLYGANPQNKDLRVLGVATLYDRKEYNWVDVIPGTKSGEGADVKYSPTELTLPGRVAMIDMWVWSGNFDYYMEAFVRDYKGIVHTIPMGDLNFVGWKNMRVYVPESIPQSKKYLPKREGLSFVKFRIWTRPTENVAILTGKAGASQMDMAVKFYFDNLKVLTDTFETLFDGDNLTSPDVVKDAWSEGGK
jgi:hypothetical protein